MDNIFVCVYGFICTTLGVISGYFLGRRSD